MQCSSLKVNHNETEKLVMRFANFLILAILFTGQSAFTAEVFEFYNGVRQLGMGGAAIAVVNDETALLINPAGLGKLRDYFFTVADPEIEGSQNAMSLAGTDALKMFQPQPMLDKLNDTANLGKRLHLKGQVFPSVVVPNFGFGLFAKYQTDGMVNKAGTLFELNYTNDYAAVFGFNFRMWDGIIKLGTTARMVNRVQIKRTDIPANSTGLTIDNLATEGFGVGADVGLTLAAPIVWLPTISAVWRDAGGTSYDLKGGMFTSAVTIPNHTPQTVDVAFAVFPIASNRTRFAFTTEYRDILTLSDEDDQMRRLHVGIEMNVADAFFLRAGLNQRYYTAGLEFATDNYQFQMATYGEEVGTPSTTEEDRRYVFKFAFRF